MTINLIDTISLFPEIYFPRLFSMVDLSDSKNLTTLWHYC